MICVPSTGTWPGFCSALTEAGQDVNHKSLIIDCVEKVKKKRSEMSGMCTKLAEVSQMVGSALADYWRLVTKALPTSLKLKRSTNLWGF